MEKIRIKYHDPDLVPIKKKDGSDWIDLRASEDIFIGLGDFKLISLGVSMELPKGYEAHVLPRSSTFLNFGIIMTNSMGIIDESYCGDNDVWKFPAMCLLNTIKSDTDKRVGTLIRKNDRICQFRIMKKMDTPEIEEVEILGNDDRNGFGSTGIK